MLRLTPDKIITFFLFSLFFNLPICAEEIHKNGTPQDMLLSEIRNKYDVMESLSEKADDLEGEAFLKNYVRMREVNTELRTLIDHAIRDRILSDMIIVETIAIQREDAAFGFSEIPIILNDIAQEIYDSDSREKLKLLGE